MLCCDLLNPQKDEDIISLEDDPDLANLLDNELLSSSLDLDPRLATVNALVVIMDLSVNF